MKAAERKILRFGYTTVVLLSLFLGLFLPHAMAQGTAGTFTRQTQFAIPSQNGVVHFNFNGSYSHAELSGDTWIFTNLAINGTIALGNLKVSAKNSNITIYTFYASTNNSFFGRISTIRVHVDGDGEQTYDIGVKVNRQTHQSEWGVTVPTTVGGTDFLAEGPKWHLHSDNTVTVDGVVGNYSISYYGYRFYNEEEANKPFVEKHSVAIASAVVVAAVLAIATLISVRARRIKVVGS